MLSPHPAPREAGAILRELAVVAPRTLGCPLSMIVLVTLEREGMRTIDELMGKLEAQPEVIEAWQITGEYDFAVKVVARNMEDYDALTTNCDWRAFSHPCLRSNWQPCGEFDAFQGKVGLDRIHAGKMQQHLLEEAFIFVDTGDDDTQHVIALASH